MRLHGIKTRRDFLRFSARTMSAVGAAAAFGPAGLLNQRASAQSSDYKALVCIFLFGGNDANNMLIPSGGASAQYPYSFYSTVRGALAIPQAQLVTVYDPVTNQDFGLHPSLAPLGQLYKPAAGAPRLAMLANVGTLVQPITRTTKPNLNVALPANLYSHSDQQQEWQNAVPSPAALVGKDPRNASTGWAGRLIDKLATAATFPAGIGIDSGALQLVGINSQPTTLGGNGFTVANKDPDAMTGLQQMLVKLPGSATLLQALQGSMSDALKVSQTIDALLANAGSIQSQFPNTGLGQQLAQVASVISVAQGGLGANRQIFFCSQGGYDTHSGQAGQQAQLFTELGGAMAAFDTWLQGAGFGNKVATFTESDFSRTFQPNGNAGTDHAWGSHALIMGPVKAARIYGTFPTLKLQGPDDASDRGAWAPTTSSDQYSAELAKWFGLAPADLGYVFPNLGTVTGNTMSTPGFLV